MSIMYFNSLWIIQRVACILYKTARAAAATLKFSKRDVACWSRKGSFMRGSRRQMYRAGRQSIRPVACNTRHSTLHACCNFGFCFCYGFLFLLRSLGLTHTHTHTHILDITGNFGRNRQLDNAFLCLNLLFCGRRFASLSILLFRAIKCNKLFTLCQMHICYNNNNKKQKQNRQ